MGQRIRRIISIWHWEWMHEWRGHVFGVIAQWVLLLSIFVLYRLQKGRLFQLIGAIMQLPSWFYAFLGLEPSVQTGNISFFLFYMLMILNTWNAWRSSERVFENVDRDELSGSVFMICNQWFDRRQLVWGKWSWLVVSLAVRQLALYLWAMLLVVIGSLNREQRLGACKRLVGSWEICFLVMVLYVTLSFFRATSRKHRPGSSTAAFRRRLFWLPFFLGSLYKLRNAIFAATELVNRPIAGKMPGWLEWMDRLYWISPLSWMNVYRQYGDGRMWIQCGLCVGISVCALLVGARRYRDREFLS